MPLPIYKLSFTTGDLYSQEAAKAAALYAKSASWTDVRKQILADNLFQSRTRASADRILRELLPRLQQLTPKQIKLFVNGSTQEQTQILWLAVCKHYRLIQEFAVEVIREKMFRFDRTLTYTDFDAFFNAKAEWHAELARLTPRTRSELRRVLFQMLRQAEILSSANQILAALPAPRVARAILADDPALSAIFPVSDSDFQRQAAL